MAPPVTRIVDVCDDLLAAVLTHHGGTLPGRQYVSAGPPAWDCELVAVYCESTGNVDGDPNIAAFESVTRLPSHTMRAGVFVLTIVRCTPAIPDAVGSTIINTSVHEEEAASTALHEDAQRLPNAIIAAERAGELPGCNSLALGGWTSVGPDGGFVAGELRVVVGLSTGL